MLVYYGFHSYIFEGLVLSIHRHQLFENDRIYVVFYIYTQFLETDLTVKIDKLLNKNIFIDELYKITDRSKKGDNIVKFHQNIFL